GGGRKRCPFPRKSAGSWHDYATKALNRKRNSGGSRKRLTLRCGCVANPNEALASSHTTFPCQPYQYLNYSASYYPFVTPLTAPIEVWELPLGVAEPGSLG